MKLKFEIDKEAIRSMVRAFYELDPDFVQKYHAIAGASFDDCVQYELDQIFEPGSSFFHIDSDECTIALGCVNEKALDSEEEINLFCKTIDPNNGEHVVRSLCFFFVHPNYRKKEFIPIIWECVRAAAKGANFIVGIREKNVPASQFYAKMGGKFIAKVPDHKNPGEIANLFLFGGA